MKQYLVTMSDETKQIVEFKDDDVVDISEYAFVTDDVNAILQFKREQLEEQRKRIEAEAEALRQAEREARWAAEERERNARYERLANERWAKWQIHASAIVTELKALGFNDATFERTSSGLANIFVLGRKSSEYGFGIDCESDAIIVGSYGSRSRFPMKSDGTFNCKKIAAKVAEKYNAKKAEAEREVKSKNADALSAAIANDLKQEFLPEKADRVYVGWTNDDGTERESCYEDGMVHKSEFVTIEKSQWHYADKVHVSVTFSKELTADEARAFLSVLKSAGLLDK